LFRQAQASGKIRILSQHPALVAETDRLMELAKNTLLAVDEFHKANPLAAGIPRQELVERVFGSSAHAAELFRVVMEELAGTGKLELAQESVKRAGREVPFTDEEARARAQIEEAFGKAGLTVPTMKEVLAKLPVEARRAQKILQLLLREKILIKVSEELVFHHSAMARLRELLAEQKKKSDQISVPAFKELTGVTRKYAIPLLEYLDRERVTRRVGDIRVIL
jgi:selenocysteine-specific elongation factor